MDFTFCSLTYNQESLIIEHLESIKYQIVNFGKGVNIDFVLADDHSSDNTVNRVEKWLKKNRELFNHVELYVADNNQGTVRNYIKALQLIHTNYYKILAGDDLYFKNNLFQLFMETDKSNFIISPAIYFDENCIRNENYDWFRCILSCGEKSLNIKSFLKKQYEYRGFLCTPGVFIKKALIDDGLFKALEEYKLIEDVPQFNYHLHQQQSEFTCQITPFVLYRIDSGVSHKKPSEAYMRDIERISRSIHFKKKANESYSLKVYTHLVRITGRLNPKRRKRILDFNQKINSEMKAADYYLSSIRDNAKKFLQS